MKLLQTSSTNTITVVCVHYNEALPEHIALIRKTMLANKLVNWIIFTDQPFTEEENIKVVNLSLKEISHLASLHLNFKINIKSAAKLSDFKPAYGLIFSKWLVGCNWWAHADINIIYGNIMSFIEFYLDKADLISTCATNFSSSLCFYKNTDKVNQLILKVSNIQQKLNFDQLTNISETAIDELLMYPDHGIDYRRTNHITDESSKWKAGRLYDNHYRERLALVLNEKTLTKIRSTALPICSFHK